MSNDLSRTSSPFYDRYTSYENTRLGTEYDPHTSLVAPKPSEKTSASPAIDRLVSRIRLGLRILSFLLSITMVAVLAYIVGLHNKTRGRSVEDPKTGATQRVWLSNLRTQPTNVLLGVSCAAAFLSLVVLIANFSKAVRRITAVSSLFTALFSAASVFLWMGVGFWYKADDWDETSHMDITSYVCRHRNNGLLRHELGDMGVFGGGLRYAWWAVLLASSIEMFSIATVGWGVLAVGKKGAYSKIGF